MSFIACFFSVFTVKTFHHLEAHASVFVCEQHDDRHLHESKEDVCCPLCDFFFSPVHNQIEKQEPPVVHFAENIFPVFTNGMETQFIAFHYSPRAPPR